MAISPRAIALFCFLPFCANAQTTEKADTNANSAGTRALAPTSTSVNVSVAGKVTTFGVKQLLDMPQVTVHVHNVQKNADETYSGPLVSDVLEAAGLRMERESESSILHSSVVATGAYRYFVVFSAAEIEPSFTKNQTIVAVMKAGLPNPDGKLGIVTTGDTNATRWVHGLTDLAVMTLSQNKQ